MQNVQYEYLDDRYQNIAIMGSEEKKSTYLAKDTVTGRFVVKKYIQPESVEVYTKLSTLQNPYLVKIYYVAVKEVAALVIMEYVSGRTIEEWQKEVGVFSEEIVICYIEQLLRGIIEIHGQDIIHRDINPKNVLISTDGVVKLLDFDIGRQFKESKGSDTTILGTVGFAAPEQFGFTQSDKRTDIYAVGVLMNVMLTGKLPGEQMYSNGRVGYIIQICTQMDPMKRYQNAEEILREMELLRGTRCEVGFKDSQLETKEKQNGEKSIIPGFRTGKLWKKIIAVTYYIMMGIFSVDMLVECAKTPVAAALEFAALLTYIWLAAFLPLNFLNWMNKVPVIKKFKKGGRIILGIFLWIFLFYFGVMLENYVRIDMLHIVTATK